MARKKGYGQFCPVAKACEVIAERWTPLVLRELLCGSRRFNDLRRGVPLMSSSLLSQRLKELEWAGVIERQSEEGEERKSGYYLTDAGEALRPIIESLGAWGHQFTRSDMKGDDLDAGLLMWDIRRRVSIADMPSGRFVVHFELSGAPRSKKFWWLVKDDEDIDLCLKDPGYDVDLTILTDLRTMTQVWMGDVKVSEALRSKKLNLEGTTTVQRGIGRWLGLSFFAPIKPQDG